MTNKGLRNCTWEVEDNKVVGIGITRIDETHYTISSTFIVDSEVDTIDIISNDTNQVYVSLDGSSLIAGNTYTLTENMRIE